ncbi:MAG: hypothetical protein ACR2PL_02050, partial [Dehalococcoidia bacterium]
REFRVEPETWYGARDRSWGIRPVGEPAQGGAPVPRGTFYWNWAPIQFADRSLLFTVSEDADGVRWHDSTVLLPHTGASGATGSGSLVRMHDVRHAWQFQEGTRIFDGGRLAFADPEGHEFSVTVRPLGPVWHMFGGGYGPPWRHGVYQGALTVEGDRWDLSTPEAVRRVTGLDETLCAFELDGQIGYGPFEFACFGPYRPYGFQ